MNYQVEVLYEAMTFNHRNCQFNYSPSPYYASEGCPHGEGLAKEARKIATWLQDNGWSLTRTSEEGDGM